MKTFISNDEQHPSNALSLSSMILNNSIIIPPPL